MNRGFKISIIKNNFKYEYDSTYKNIIVMLNKKRVCILFFSTNKCGPKLLFFFYQSNTKKHKIKTNSDENLVSHFYAESN